MLRIDEAYERLTANLGSATDSINAQFHNAEAASRLTVLVMHYAVSLGRADLVTAGSPLHKLVAKCVIVCSPPFGVEFLGGADGFIAAIAEAVEACPRARE